MFLSPLIPPPIRKAIRRYREHRRLRTWAMSYYEPQLEMIKTWLADPNEVTNFTYDITDMNKAYLSHFVANITGITVDQARAYIREIDEDADLISHVRKRTLEVNRAHADTTQSVGRRMGWYAFARALKPKLIVETGVEKGLGSCVLSKALLRNAGEGHPGRYVGTDIDGNAGYLYTEPYSSVGKILYGDSIETLRQLTEPIDLFINDSDHSEEYEAREYQTIADKLSPNGVILGDNSHVSPKLAEFASSTGRQFLFWPEKPKDHWYPGCGIGVARPR